MLKYILLSLTIAQVLYSEKLSFKQAVLKSPFEVASLGNIVFIPNEDAFLIRGVSSNWDQWYKVSIPGMDTTLFLGENTFIYEDEKLLVEDLILSKRGQMILVKTEVRKLWRHSHYANYYVYDLKSELLTALTNDNKDLRNVKFSPNGRYIAYVRKDNNLYIYEIYRKRERKLTSTGSKLISNGHFGWLYEEEFSGYDGYRWSPDSKSIAYWEEDNSLVPEFYMLNKLTSYPQIKKIRYPKVGENNPSLRIGIVRVSGSGRKWLQYGSVRNNDYLPWMKWVNSKKVAFIKMDRKQQKMDMYISDRETGRSHHTLSEIDSTGWLDNHEQIYFLKNGMIVHISEKSGYKHIWLSKHSGSKSWAITEGKWEVKSIEYIDQKNRLVYFTANKASIHENKLYSVDFDGNQIKCLTREAGNHQVLISNSKEYFFDSYSSFDQPKKNILKRLVTGSTIKVINETNKDQYRNYEWSKPYIVNFETLDKNDTLYGCVTRPPDFDQSKKYPVIIHGYGMPGTQSVWNQWSNIWNQFLAQNGYVVFHMDTRGMGGRGEKFKNLSYGDMSKYLSLDHLAGINYLKKNLNIDPERVGAWGWSGGGYFTCLMLTRNAKSFKAGVAVAPVTDFKLYDTAYTERIMGLLKENKSGYDSTSTISWINKMEGSLLLIHGEDDDNVHSQNTSQFVEKAVKLGKNIDWIQYPGRNHGIYGNGARADMYKKMLEFFKLKL